MSCPQSASSSPERRVKEHWRPRNSVSMFPTVHLCTRTLELPDFQPHQSLFFSGEDILQFVFL